MENHGIDTTCAFTGHRPYRFLFGYDESHPLCKKIKAALRTACIDLYQQNAVRTFISGCALGVDQWALEEAIKLRDSEFFDMQVCCAAPYRDFANRWSVQQKKRLRSIWDAADVKGFVGNRYGNDVYFQRNRFMVDRARFLIAVYDRNEEKASGTRQTVEYARRNRRSILFIHPDTGEISR